MVNPEVWSTILAGLGILILIGGFVMIIINTVTVINWMYIGIGIGLMVLGIICIYFSNRILPPKNSSILSSDSSLSSD